MNRSREASTGSYAWLLEEAFPATLARSRKSLRRIREMFKYNWYLGLTSFGGPAVHFQIFRQLFVEKYKWIDEQMFQELFALCQALPGPASTKMLFAINIIRFELPAGIISFFVWTLPAAISAYGLSLGVNKIGASLPAPVYALLTGLNAATVGIVALAAVQLSQKAISDKITRVMVFLGATAGILYNALWYFPVIMCAAGFITVVWDYKILHNLLKYLQPVVPSRHRNNETNSVRIELAEPGSSSFNGPDRPNASTILDRNNRTTRAEANTMPLPISDDDLQVSESQRVAPPSLNIRWFSWKWGIVVIVCFFATFLPVMILRGVLKNPPRGFSLFANMYLAGTIIFGGGPVVIPLLREYVVAEGWVTPRDFLLGLAVIQAFPGPNFNFAVYLGSLAALSSSGQINSASGAVIGLVGIFSPGLILLIGCLGLWKTLRGYRCVTSALRGINAAAVGLVYTAVYRLWEIGNINEANQNGESLAQDPWWVVITATSFVGGMWFQVPAPAAIILGGVMGMVWYGVNAAK